MEKINTDYKIASRAAQSNSVYVSVLKIPIVHADEQIASPEMFCFSREWPLLARGKILYFATNSDSVHQSQNEDNFATFSLGLEFLNEAEKEKKTRKFCFIFHLPRTITSDIVVRFVWRALKKLKLPSAIASGNSYASFVLSKLPACSITR